MGAIKKEVLEKIEKTHGLEPGDLTYQQRCSRAAAYQQGRGSLWSVQDTETWKKSQEEIEAKRRDIKNSPLYKKKILITPKLTPDAKRALYVEEDLGPEMEVSEVDAGAMINASPEDTERMFGDYKVERVRQDRRTYGKTWVPKVGTEISYTLGEDIVPVVEGNDGQKGYIWSYPSRVLPVNVNGEITYVQVYGLKTLIATIYPELLEEFKGKPLMTYIDGVTLAASIPLTKALLKKHRKSELKDRALGFK